MGLLFLDRSDIWQASRQQIAASDFKTIQSHPIL